MRRHGPRGYRNYTSYKPWLRDEFSFQYVYCLCRERWFPDGEAAFSIDHLRPQTSTSDLRTAYNNLIYACGLCNAVRGLSSAPDPSEHAYGRHLQAREDGLAEALTPTGRELIEICRLNRPNLVSFRRGVLEVLTLLRQRKGTQMEVLVRNYLGFPTSLPNLAILRPPAGNSRPGGIHQSYYARRSRGELPDTY